MTTSKQAANRRRKLYIAVGAVRGQYQPGESVFSKGILLADDGTKFPAILHHQLEQHLLLQPELLNQQQIFAVWPITSASSPELFFKLKSIRKEDSMQPGILEADVDKFSVYGVVVCCDSQNGKFFIQIQRNKKAPLGLELDPAWQPFKLEITGQLPNNAVGQFWELSCRRHSNQLVLLSANPFVKVPSPTKTPTSPTTTLTADTSRAKNSPTASPNAATTPTPGKLEVVVKINQFPNDVRTVDKGWKEFSVNTGSGIVTITVKPKAFAALEQAQQTYPDWVAAISGQIGSALGTDFRLASPAIKVFERQPKSSAQPEPTTDSNSSYNEPTQNERQPDTTQLNDQSQQITQEAAAREDQVFPSSKPCSTIGKLELTIKINEFPADVRTFDNGWKQFDVDTGNQLVTIALKPKLFNKLSQAQENYSQWVAAIAGLRGETSDRGFVLLEPNIQVFERQAKSSATAETTHTKDNSLPSLATNSQQSPPETTPQQSVVLPETTPQQQPTASPKQLGQNQQRLNVQAGIQQRDQINRVQQQATSSTLKNHIESSQPAFQVKVNDQVFSGYNSVTLNKRVLSIDGKTVAQAKMVIVLGQPKTVQADGGVSQGRNQAVLISR